jgi:hypothetical protein
MDATMKRTKVSSMIAIALSLLLVPTVWIFAFDAIPSFQVVQADTSGGRMGPWVFTWALVWIATFACFVVAWLCYSSLDDATS